MKTDKYKQKVNSKNLQDSIGHNQPKNHQILAGKRNLILCLLLFSFALTLFGTVNHLVKKQYGFDLTHSVSNRIRITDYNPVEDSIENNVSIIKKTFVINKDIESKNIENTLDVKLISAFQDSVLYAVKQWECFKATPLIEKSSYQDYQKVCTEYLFNYYTLEDSFYKVLQSISQMAVLKIMTGMDNLDTTELIALDAIDLINEHMSLPTINESLKVVAHRTDSLNRIGGGHRTTATIEEVSYMFEPIIEFQSNNEQLYRFINSLFANCIEINEICMSKYNNANGES